MHVMIKFEKVFHALLEELKPETAYFFPEGGERAGLFVVDMKESPEVAEIAALGLIPGSKWYR
jgi:hypothetical protein